MKFNLLKVLCLSLMIISCTKPIRYTDAEYKKVPTKDLKSSSKHGRACTDDRANYEDITVETARKNGGITKISTIEQEYERELFSRKICTIVKGE